jgi:hypothetical protein
MTTMFAVTGTLLSVVSRAHNQGKVCSALPVYLLVSDYFE